MIYVMEDKEDFMKRYNLTIKKDSCYKCGRELILDLPFLLPKYVGMTHNDLCCGEQYRIHTFIPRFVEDQERLNEAFSQIVAHLQESPNEILTNTVFEGYEDDEDWEEDLEEDETLN